MNTSATVEVLTAEVRALMVGSRQVTLSVYRQLDFVDPDAIEPFGRVRDNQDSGSGLYVIGRGASGTLVRSATPNQRNHVNARSGAPTPWVRRARPQGVTNYDGRFTANIEGVRVNFSGSEVKDDFHMRRGEWAWISPDIAADVTDWALADNQTRLINNTRHARWAALPLIVLAGLR